MTVIDTKLSQHINDCDGLLQESDLLQLEGMTIGIDLHYLVELLQKTSKTAVKQSTEEEFAVIAGLVLDFVKELFEFSIKPFFVLSGLRTYNQFQIMLTLDESHGQNKTTGKFIDKLNLSKWVQFFNSNDILNFVVAPYSCLTQLTYLFAEGFIDAIVGPTELLMFNKINRVIVDVFFSESKDIQQKTFQFVDKFDVFESINIKNQLEFTELMLILKNSFQPVSFVIPSIVGKSFKNVVEINKKNPLKLAYLNSKQQELLDKAIMSLYSAPVFQLNGHIGLYCFLELEISSSTAEKEQDSAISDDDDDDDENEYMRYITKFNKQKLSSVEPPSDSYEFLGKRLPDEIAFYQSLGMFEELNKVLESIVYGTYLDSSDFEDSALDRSLYENLQTFLFESKQQETKLIVNCMTRYFHKQNIIYKNLNSPINLKFHLNTMQSAEMKAFKRISFKIDKKETSSFADYFKFDFSSQIFTKLSVGESFDNVESLIFSVIWRVLVNCFHIAGDVETDDATNTLRLMNSKDLPFIEKIVSNLNSCKNEEELETFTVILLIIQVSRVKDTSDLSFINYKLIYQFKLMFKELFETVLVWSLLTGDFDRLKFTSVAQWQKEFVSKLPFQHIDSIYQSNGESDAELKRLISLV